VPFFLGDFVNADGTPHAQCPRQTLKRVLKRAEKMGFQVMTGMEFEWFNFLETPADLGRQERCRPQQLTPGMFGYSLLRMNEHREFFNALMDEMLAFNVPIEGLHTETGPGVYEAAIGFRGAGAGRPRHPVQDRHQGDRRAFRHHAQLHGQAAPEPAGLQRPHPPEPVGRQDQPVLSTRRTRAR
jgi:glutamine synthetase